MYIDKVKMKENCNNFILILSSLLSFWIEEGKDSLAKMLSNQ